MGRANLSSILRYLGLNLNTLILLETCIRRLLRGFSRSMLDCSSRFHLGFNLDFQANNFRVLSLARFDLHLVQFGDLIGRPFSAANRTAYSASGKTALFIFSKSQFSPRIFGIFAIGSLARCADAEKVQIGPSVFVSGRKVLLVLQFVLAAESRPRIPFCNDFTLSSRFSIFLHINQKHIKVCKFLVFFYIKYMQKGSKI